MKELVILGAGETGIALIDKIREKDSQCKITLIDKNAYYFNKRELITKLSFKSCLDLKNWARERNIDFICDRLERINFNRRKMYFKESEAKDFEVLVIAAGLKSKKMPIKGEHREGFFYFSEIDPFKLRDLLKISSESTVYAATVLGLKLALALRVLGKEVTVVADNWDFLEEDKERVVSFFKEKNILVYLNSSIEEVIGEGVVKAVKISPLKVFSSQLVFVDSGFSANCDFFEEEVSVPNHFFTNYEEVYWLGGVIGLDVENERFFSHNCEEIKRQSRGLGEFLLNGESPVFNERQAEGQDKRKVVEDIFGFGEYSDSQNMLGNSL